jgi:hypothetical protein
MADGTDVLVCHAYLHAPQYLRLQISGLVQQNLHLLDRSKCDHHHGRFACYVRQLQERRIRLRSLRCE